MIQKAKNRRGFTLVELLVVISVIAILIGLLLPSVTKARAKSNQVACMSNMRQIGMQMLIYADQWNGYLFPADMGWDTTLSQIAAPYPPGGAQIYQDPLQDVYQPRVWPYVMFGVWNPPIMLCPTDELPMAQHSYILNDHMKYWNVRYSSGLPGNQSPSDVVLMGEKVTTVADYYMEYSDFSTKVEPYRHGVSFGSNYLKLDLHVDTELPAEALNALDPWDLGNGLTPPTTNPTPVGGS